MEETKDPQQPLMDYVIKKATEYADNTYSEKSEAKIAARAYALGYHQAHQEKTKEIKDLAGIVKLLLPGIAAVSTENLKTIEEYIKRVDRV